jgi:hypothetical protein
VIAALSRYSNRFIDLSKANDELCHVIQ